MSYQQPLRRTWWLKHRHFALYMLREATVLPLVFFLCSLLAGMWSLATPQHWLQWQAFMAQPWVIAIHGLALIAALYHAATFFVLFPRVMPIRIGTKSVPSAVMVAGQWFAVVAVIALFLWLFLFVADQV